MEIEKNEKYCCDDGDEDGDDGDDGKEEEDVEDDTCAIEEEERQDRILRVFSNDPHIISSLSMCE